jgi:integrase
MQSGERARGEGCAKVPGEEPELLEPINLHECRHTFASYMIGAGVNVKALSDYLGHSTIAITLDVYGHLLPGNKEEAAALLDAYLERSDTAASIAQLEGGEDDEGGGGEE